MIRATIIGITGRMGRALVRAAAETIGTPDEIQVTAAIAAATSLALGADAGELSGVGRLGVAVTSDLSRALADSEVAIDFSNAAATAANLAACRAAGKALLIGTTGFAASLESEFEAAGRSIPLLVAANTSIGITLLESLVRMVANALPESFDIQIVEAHHRMKRDAPSGTALALGKAAKEGRAGADIGYAVVRGGDIVGEHSVLFAGAGERITLAHSATDRAIFARGALRAAAWLARKPFGRYAMCDVVFSKSAT